MEIIEEFKRSIKNPPQSPFLKGEEIPSPLNTRNEQCVSPLEKGGSE